MLLRDSSIPAGPAQAAAARRASRQSLDAGPDAPSAGTPTRWAWAWPVATLLAALLGAWGSRDAPTVYAMLELPRWAPPAAVFGPVWTLLYLLMGLAAWQVARKPSRWRRPALTAFGVHLLLNAGWSWAFFDQRWGGGSLIVIGALWVALATTGVLFSLVRRGSAMLLLPTLAWVSFAAALNLSIWLRNPLLLS